MAQKRLTDIDFASGITGGDLIHIVITGDPSQNIAGSSYKTPMNNVLQFIGDNFTSVFTGGTFTGPFNFTNGITANTINANSISGNNANFTNLSANTITTSGLTVNGSSTFNSGVTINGDLTVSGTVSGNTGIFNNISANTITTGSISGTNATFTNLTANSITTSAFTLNGVTLTSLSALTGMDVEFFGEKTIYYSDQITSSPYLDDPNNLYDRNKPKTPSISAVTAGGTPPYTYNWSIVEGPFAGHRFHSSFDYSATTGDSVYLQVNYNYKPLGPRVSNTLNAMDGSTKASTTLKLVTTDSNGFKNTSYYTYTVTDCYPIMDLNFCLTNNEYGPDFVEYYDIGKSYFNWVLPAIGFLDDERTVPTCIDLDNLGCEIGDLENIMTSNRARRDLFNKNQIDNINKLTTKGIFFKDGIIDFNKSPYYSNNQQYFLNFNQLTNTLESKKDLFFTNNGKVPLSNIKVFGPGCKFTKINDDNIAEGDSLWETAASTDPPLAGETLAQYFPNVTDLFYRQAVKTESDLPTLNDVIPPDNNQMIYVINTNETWIWDDGAYSSNPRWVNASNIGVFNDISTIRRATASAQNKATYEWWLSQSPFLWANIYIPLHIAKKRFI